MAFKECHRASLRILNFVKPQILQILYVSVSQCSWGSFVNSDQISTKIVLEFKVGEQLCNLSLRVCSNDNFLSVTHIFSVSLKFRACYTTSQWGKVTVKNATLYLPGSTYLSETLPWKFLLSQRYNGWINMKTFSPASFHSP